MTRVEADAPSLGVCKHQYAKQLPDFLRLGHMDDLKIKLPKFGRCREGFDLPYWFRYAPKIDSTTASPSSLCAATINVDSSESRFATT